MLGVGDRFELSSDDNINPNCGALLMIPEGDETPDPAPKLVQVCEDHCDCHKARDKIRKFMQPFLRMYNTSFRDIIDADASLRPLGTDDIEEKVQLILTDLPLEIIIEDNDDNDLSTGLVDEGMEQTVQVMARLLRPGGHLIMFCCSEQYEEWRELLACFTGADEEGDIEDGEEESADSAKVFSVDSQPFQFIFKPEHSDVNCEAAKTMKFRAASMMAIHARKNGISVVSASKMVRLRPFGYVHSRHPATCNVIDNVPRLTKREAFWLTKNGREHLVNEKSLDLWRELICRFSFPGDIVVDLFSRRFSAAVACFTICDDVKGRIRTFVGTEVDEKVFASGVHRVENAVAGALADESQRTHLFKDTLDSEIIEAACLLHQHTACGGEVTRDMWLPPPTLPLTSLLPRYITDHILLRFRAMHQFKRVNGKLFEKWPREVQEAVQNTDVENLLAVECSSCGVYVAPSLIKHTDAGMGVFANRSFSKNDLIATFYGILVYEDLSNRFPLDRRYGEGFSAFTISDYLAYSIAVKVSNVCEFAAQIPETMSSTKETCIEVYVVPFRFCVAGRINDARYRDGDLERHGDRKRTCNVQFLQRVPGPNLKRLRQLTEVDLIQVVASRDIEKNEELYTDYGDKHAMV